ncbi:hypothetical protein JCM3775_007211 [Rhodotorula graminis]|uniref:Peptidase C15, pyroglutamyl peptidase I-like protein n=1 Tax=Rhodotorula graminis (strain WP1) TaxID=578459 RepID=A0A194S1K4_RHOGW|nr:uncharacterized protein RHOBADRAFT_44890 [Rhodotorula graminis WP1]KPV74399.1 hypothetical protein RHOBADRAFT_44890 [Rhodotorula graminis WP1]
MAPLDQLEHDQQPFRVHLTGFGPFGPHAVNASWETVRPLDGTVLDEPPTFPGAPPPYIAQTASRRRRPVHLSTSLLSVKYSTVLSSVPALHALDTDSARPPYDLVIHCGVSGDDRAVRLEQRARKFGYDKEDVERELAPRAADGRRGFSGERWAACPEELRTTVNAARVSQCARNRGVEHLSPSQDAGLYLCEFSLYASLASAQLRNPDRPTPVLFVHVPPLDTPYSADELTAAMRIIVWAIVNEGGLDS